MPQTETAPTTYPAIRKNAPSHIAAIRRQLPKLRDYTKEPVGGKRFLNPDHELEKLRDALDALSQSPSFSAAKVACRRSRMVYLAVGEESWRFGRDHVSYRKHFNKAAALLDKLGKLENSALSVAKDREQKKDIETFFSNMAARNTALSEIRPVSLEVA